LGWRAVRGKDGGGVPAGVSVGVVAAHVAGCRAWKVTRGKFGVDGARELRGCELVDGKQLRSVRARCSR
jgi:hypothetical protein